MRMTALFAIALLTLPWAAPQDEDVRFANPELLVSTDWLVANLAAEGVRIVDVRTKDFEDGHVPGAVHLSVSDTFDPAGPNGIVGKPEAIAELLGKRGIDRDTHVVLYDEGRSTKAARVFWTLEYYGHARVSVVDGGWAKWQAEKREVAKKGWEARRLEYELAPQPQHLSTVDRLMDGMGAVAVVDARSDREWDAGRVPGAIHIDFVRNFTDDKVAVFKSPKELAALYADVPRDVEVHSY
jgi:thiosulfate/3-mercaptopyruvate sulfurtransferase